jgi:hypothetical protein
VTAAAGISPAQTNVAMIYDNFTPQVLLILVFVPALIGIIAQLAVARLAGVPAPVVARAKAVLAKLEATREATGGIAAGLGDLPLFAALRPEPAPVSPEQQLADALRAADLDALTPREALDLLYDWKRQLPRPHG